MRLREIYSQANIGLRDYFRQIDENPFDPYEHLWIFTNKYLQDLDEDDFEEVRDALLTALNLDANEDIKDDPSDFGDWLEDHIDADDYENFPEKIRRDFETKFEDDYVSYVAMNDPLNAPTSAYFMLKNKQLLPRTTWLVHFSDNAASIAYEGFKYGVDHPGRLSLTTYIDNQSFDKKYGGYNFAFLANDRDAYHAALSKKYGKHAVMFQSSGLKVHHYGDEETQIIFYGPEVDPRNIILLYNDGGDWQVTSKYKDDPLFTGSFDKVVKWVQNNYHQYRKQLRSS